MWPSNPATENWNAAKVLQLTASKVTFQVSIQKAPNDLFLICSNIYLKRRPERGRKFKRFIYLATKILLDTSSRLSEGPYVHVSFLIDPIFVVPLAFYVTFMSSWTFLTKLKFPKRLLPHRAEHGPFPAKVWHWGVYGIRLHVSEPPHSIPRNHTTSLNILHLFAFYKDKLQQTHNIPSVLLIQGAVC